MAHLFRFSKTRWSLRLARFLGVLATAIAGISIMELAPAHSQHFSPQSRPALSWPGSSAAISAELARPKQRDDDLWTQADQLLMQGADQANQWRFREALVSLEQSLVLFRQIDDPRGEANVLHALGSVYASLEQYDRALDHLTQSLELARAHNNYRDQFFALNLLSEVYWVIEDFPKAIRHSEQMVDLARQHSPSIESVMGALQTLAIAYDRSGQPDQAIAIYNDILALIRANFPPNYLSEHEEDTLANLGGVYAEQGQYDQAIGYYQQALDIASNHGLLEREALYRRDLGQVYTETGRYGEAETALRRSLEILSTLRRAGFSDAANISRLETLRRVSMHLQRALVGQGKYQDALEVAEAARSRTFADLLARADLRPDDSTAQVTPDLEKFKAMAREQRATIVLYTTENIDPNAESVHAYLQYYLLDLWLIDPQGNVTFSQWPISDENLDDLIATTRQAIELFYGDRPDATPIFRLFDRQAQLDEMGFLAPRDPRPAVDVFRTPRTMGLEEAVLDNLYDHHQLSMYPGVSRIFPNREDGFALDRYFVIPHVGTAATPDVAAIQTTAQSQGATLVQYSLVENRQGDAWLYAWVVQPDGRTHFRSVTLNQVPGLKADLENIDATSVGYRSHPRDSALTRLVGGMLTNLDPRLEYSDRHVAQLYAQLHTLHRILIDPIANLLPTDPEAQVVFIPEDSLFLVPFAALRDANGTYLIEKHTLLTAPSTQVLTLANQRATRLQTRQGEATLSTRFALVVGDPAMPEIWTVGAEGKFTKTPLRPLPASRIEAEEIGRALNITPLLGAQATKTEILRSLPSARWIHFATHGLLDYGDPLTYGTLDAPGAIALSASDGTDGLLTATEIMALPLQAELAILSACDTGQGRITSDGVVGLSRAFLTAGVPSVMVSLWTVPDVRTARLMRHLYRQIDQGQDKAQALRQAMLANLADTEHPIGWAAFTLVGSGR